MSKKKGNLKNLTVQDIQYLLKVPNNVMNNNKNAISNILFIVSDKINLVV